jgi:septin family protein
MGCCHSSAKGGRSHAVEDDASVTHLQSQRRKSTGLVGGGGANHSCGNQYNGSDDGVSLTFDIQDCKEVEQSFKKEEQKRLAEERQQRELEERQQKRRLEESNSRMEDQEVQWKAHDEEMEREQAQIRAQSESAAAHRAGDDEANVLTL